MLEARSDEQAVVQQASEHTQLVVTTFFRGKTSSMVWRYWTKPKLITQWWSERAKVDIQEGGEYHLSWPALGCELRGTYTAVEAYNRLVFTWACSNEADAIAREVEVRLDPVGDIGTQLTLTHSAYGASLAEQEKRQKQLDNWTYYLARLHSALA